MCEGWVFRGPGGVFCGRFWGDGEARMGGFAAKFRGFWAGRERGATIQRTADAAGLVWRKIFLKEGEKPKIWGARGTGRWSGSILHRVCGVVFMSGD